MTHESAPDGSAIDREQRRIEAMGLQEGAKAASPDEVATAYGKRVNDFQAKVRLLRKETAITRDRNKPEWQKLDDLCSASEKKVFDHLCSILSPEELSAELQPFTQALDTIMATLHKESAAPAEDPSVTQARAALEKMQDDFSALQDEESYWKSQSEDAVRTLSTYPKDAKGQFVQDERTAGLLKRQLELIGNRQKQLSDVRGKMGTVAHDLALRDIALTRIESDRAMQSGDTERGHRLLLKTWERYGKSLQEMDGELWKDLPASVRALGDAQKLSSFESAYFQHLVAEQHGQEIADSLGKAIASLSAEGSAVAPAPVPEPASLAEQLNSSVSRPPPDPNGLRPQTPHLDEALSIALAAQQSLNDRADLVDQARTGGMRLGEYQEPTWGIENKPTPDQGRLQTVSTQSGSVKGVLIPPTTLQAIDACPSGMTVVLRRKPQEIVLQNPQNKPGLGGWLGLNKTGYRIQKLDTLRREDIAFVALKAEAMTVRRPDGNTDETYALAELDRERDEHATDVLRCIDRDPKLQNIQGAARSLQDGCTTLQTLFGSGIDGNKYQAFVDFSRGKALEMRGLLADTAIRSDTKALKSMLEQLKGAKTGLAYGGLEASIGAHIQALDGFLTMLESGQLQHVIDTMIDKSQWDANTWLNWAKQDLPVIVGSIAGAVAAITALTLLAPVGVPAFAMLVAQGAAGAGGAAVGGGLAKEGVHAAYNLLDADVQRGDASFTEHSRPVAQYKGDKVYDAEKGAMRSRELWRDTASPMAAEFIQNALISVATMGVAKVGADKISRFLTNSKVVNVLSKRSSLLKRVIDRLSKMEDQKTFWQKMAGEIPEELGEEAAEPAVDRVLGAIHPLLGNVGSVLVGMVNGVDLAKPGTLPGLRAKCVQAGLLVSDITIDGKPGCRVVSADGQTQWKMREADATEMEGVGVVEVASNGVEQQTVGVPKQQAEGERKQDAEMTAEQANELGMADRFLQEDLFGNGSGRTETGIAGDFTNCFGMLVASFGEGLPADMQSRFREKGIASLVTYDTYLQQRIDAWNQDHPKVAFEDAAIQQQRHPELDAAIAEISPTDSADVLRAKFHRVAELTYGAGSAKLAVIDAQIGWTNEAMANPITATDERVPDAPQDAPVSHDLAKAGDVEGLKTYLQQHKIDDATRSMLADTLVNRSLHPSVHTALGQSHVMPGAIDEGNMAKNIPKLGNVYDAIKAELMGLGHSEVDAHTQAMREAKLLLDAGLAGMPSFFRKLIGSQPVATESVQGPEAPWASGQAVIVQGKDGRSESGWQFLSVGDGKNAQEGHYYCAKIDGSGNLLATGDFRPADVTIDDATHRVPAVETVSAPIVAHVPESAAAPPELPVAQQPHVPEPDPAMVSDASKTFSEPVVSPEKPPLPVQSEDVQRNHPAPAKHVSMNAQANATQEHVTKSDTMAPETGWEKGVRLMAGTLHQSLSHEVGQNSHAPLWQFRPGDASESGVTDGVGSIEIFELMEWAPESWGRVEFEYDPMGSITLRRTPDGKVTAEYSAGLDTAFKARIQPIVEAEAAKLALSADVSDTATAPNSVEAAEASNVSTLPPAGEGDGRVINREGNEQWMEAQGAVDATPAEPGLADQQVEAPGGSDTPAGGSYTEGPLYNSPAIVDRDAATVMFRDNLQALQTPGARVRRERSNGSTYWATVLRVDSDGASILQPDAPEPTHLDVDIAAGTVRRIIQPSVGSGELTPHGNEAITALRTPGARVQIEKSTGGLSWATVVEVDESGGCVIQPDTEPEVRISEAAMAAGTVLEVVLPTDTPNADPTAKQAESEPSRPLSKKELQAQKTLQGVQDGTVTLEEYAGLRDAAKPTKIPIDQQEQLAREVLKNSARTIDDVINLDGTVGEARTLTAEVSKQLEQADMREFAESSHTDSIVTSLAEAVRSADALAAMDAVVEQVRNPAEKRMLGELLTEVRGLECTVSDQERAIIFRETVEYLQDYKAALAAGGFEGAHPTAADIFRLLQNNQRKLAHQTTVDRKYFTGSDHGVRHILEANMRAADAMAKGLGSTFTPQMRLMMRQTIIDHDMGYTLNTLDETSNYFAQTKDHPLYSGIYADQHWPELRTHFGPDMQSTYHDGVLDHSNVGRRTLAQIAQDTEALSPEENDVAAKKRVLEGEMVKKVLALADCSGATADVKMMELFTDPEMMGEMIKLHDLSAQRQILRSQIADATLRGDSEAVSSLESQIQFSESTSSAIHQKMIAMVQARYSVDGTLSPLGAAYVKALSQTFNPQDVIFAINRDFGSHSGTFEGVTLDSQRLLTFSYGLTTAFPLVREKFGDKVATSAFVKVMDDFGLTLEVDKPQKVKVNGKEHLLYTVQTFAEDLAKIYDGQEQQLTIETPQGLFRFVQPHPDGGSAGPEHPIARVVRREVTAGMAISIMRDPQASHADRIVALSELATHYDDGYTLDGRQAGDVLWQLASDMIYADSGTPLEQSAAAEATARTLDRLRHEGQGTMRMNRPNAPPPRSERRAA